MINFSQQRLRVPLKPGIQYIVVDVFRAMGQGIAGKRWTTAKAKCAVAGITEHPEDSKQPVDSWDAADCAPISQLRLQFQCHCHNVGLAFTTEYSVLLHTHILLLSPMAQAKRVDETVDIEDTFPRYPEKGKNKIFRSTPSGGNRVSNRLAMSHLQESNETLSVHHGLPPPPADTFCSCRSDSEAVDSHLHVVQSIYQ
ncbi:hypothetical protein HDE_05253 [Halotydeus destructor]|nr:hypothetical protein HDE_05253 [Halotydeus destructor]